MVEVEEKVSVLFICMGNICRSPTAEGVFRHFVEQRGLQEAVRIDSAGTHAYHSGEPSDSRAIAAAARRGYDLSGIRARRVQDEDFEEFDFVIAMDEQNLQNLQEMAGSERSTKVSLFLEYSSGDVSEVPDPYYGGAKGFERVLDLVEDASRGLLEMLSQKTP
ncbi:MAG: low molecular weight protein-tyrosine-phosphatase [Woeseiaceae bacterium]